mgnify:CR=1 FL=1
MVVLQGSVVRATAAGVLTDTSPTHALAALGGPPAAGCAVRPDAAADAGRALPHLPARRGGCGWEQQSSSYVEHRQSGWWMSGTTAAHEAATRLLAGRLRADRAATLAGG